jgi:hypothetical protein
VIFAGAKTNNHFPVELESRKRIADGFFCLRDDPHLSYPGDFGGLAFPFLEPKQDNHRLSVVF